MMRNERVYREPKIEKLAARSLRPLLRISPSSPLYIWTRSALITSPPSEAAMSRASWVFPVAVAPTIITTRGVCGKGDCDAIPLFSDEMRLHSERIEEEEPAKQKGKMEAVGSLL